MPLITELIPRRRETWLEICTAEESIRLPLGKVPAGLCAGLNVSDGQWAEFRDQAEFWGLHDKAVSILARREHFRRELEVKLGRNCRDRELVRRVLDTLEGQDYLDSRRAAEVAVQTLLNRGGLGLARIRQELTKRGCPPELAREMLAEAAGERDEQAEIAALLESREPSLRSRLARTREKLIRKGVPEPRIDYEVRQHLTAAVLRLLNGRGFTGEEAMAAARGTVARLMELETETD